MSNSCKGSQIHDEFRGKKRQGVKEINTSKRGGKVHKCQHKED